MEIEKEKTQIGFFVTPAIKRKLQRLAYENNRTMSGQLTEMINQACKDMKDDRSEALSK